jgi:general secretion pathway protein B
MSLILDALKKSEAERQRQSGPTLLEVRIAQPRRRYPTWVIAVGALLGVNMLLLLAFVLHRPAVSPAEGPQAGAAATAPAAVAASSPAPAAAPAATSSSLPASVAPVAAGAAMPATSRGPAAPGLDAPASMVGSIDTMDPAPRTLSQSEPAGDGPDGVRNPADDKPAVPAGRDSAGLQRDSSSHYANLPNFADLSGDLPNLRLDLHVYAEHVRDRYALINMHRVREGDALPEGPRVLAITREGVVLDYRGQEFMLRPQ